MKDKEIVMECEFKIKLSNEKNIKELCQLLDKWYKESKSEDKK